MSSRMRTIIQTSFEAWTQKLKELDETKFKKIQGEIPKLSRDGHLLAWKFIISLLNERLYDPKAPHNLTPLESFRLHFPKIDVPDDIKEADLIKEVRLQKRIFTTLLRAAKTKGRHSRLMVELYTLLENHFPLGSQWVAKWPARRGPKSDTVRNFCIFYLISLFRNAGLTDEKAREHVSNILGVLGQSLGLDGVRSAYLKGKDLVNKI